MAVLLQSEVDSLSFDLDHIKQTAEKLLGLVNHAESELSILLVDDTRMTELNSIYRHKDTPTNVLSFPMHDDNIHPEAILLGDIVISIDTAIRESTEKYIPLENYLTILQVHGLTHLLGYDHERGEQEALEMASFEKKLLEKLNPEYNNPLTI
jgi:probable rRNA maturation factor